MNLDNITLLLVQGTAIITFILFMIFVYIPKSVNKKNGLKKDFIQNSKVTKDFVVLTLFYVFILGHLFIFNNATYKITYYLGAVLALKGLIVAVIGRIQLRKIWNPLTNIYNSKEILNDGVFKYIRHPIYYGRFMFALGVVLMFNLWAILLIPLYWNYLKDRLILEEEYLTKVNPKYHLHIKKVKRIIF